MPRRTLHDLNPKVAEGLIARLISRSSCRALTTRNAAKPGPISQLILAGTDTQAMLVKFLRSFEVAYFISDGKFRLYNDEVRKGDSCYIRFEDFYHLFNYCGYKPVVKLIGHFPPIAKLLELKDIRQLDMNEHPQAASDEATKLISQNSAALKHLAGVPKPFFKRLPPLQLEYFWVNGNVAPNNIDVPNVKVQCFEYAFPSSGYSSAFLIKRIDAEEIVVSVFGLTTSDERSHTTNTTVKRFRIQFDHVRIFDPSRLLQDVHSAYPNLEQLFLEEGLDCKDTTFVYQLRPERDLNDILSTLQDLAAKTPFKISYARFKRFALMDHASATWPHDVSAGFKLIREKNHTARHYPRRNRLYQKRGSLANFEFFIEFELEDKY